MSGKKTSYDAGNTKDVKKAKAISKILSERERNGILKICNDHETRYVLARFFEEMGVFRDTYVTDARDDARNSGFKSAGLWWLTKALLHDPEIIAKLQTDDGSLLKGEQNNDDEPTSDSLYGDGDN